MYFFILEKDMQEELKVNMVRKIIITLFVSGIYFGLQFSKV